MAKSKVHLALYGNVGMQRGYCKQCDGTALILGNEFQCCGFRCLDEPTKVKRIVEPEYHRRKPSLAEQTRILTEQGHRCFWCDRQFGHLARRRGKLVKIKCVWDHISPYIWSADNSVDNFSASCQWCNGWKADRIFSSIEEIRVYVSTKWEEARAARNQVRELQPEYGAIQAVAEVLQQ